MFLLSNTASFNNVFLLTPAFEKSHLLNFKATSRHLALPSNREEYGSHFWSIYRLPDSVIGAEAVTATKTDAVADLMELIAC